MQDKYRNCFVVKKNIRTFANESGNVSMQW